LQDCGSVITLVPRLPSSRKSIVLRNRVLELIGAPSGFVIELQPLRRCLEFLGVSILREKTWVDDGIVGTSKGMVGQFAVACRHPSHDGGRAIIIAGRH